MIINKVTTKSGDKGFSKIFKKKIRKSDIFFEILGDLDLLNSYLGLVKSKIKKNLKSEINFIQNILFDFGAEIYLLKESKKTKIDALVIYRLEKIIEQRNINLKSLKSFIIPGSSVVDAYLHVSRALTRKIERNLTRLKPKIRNKNIFICINRISDVLFVISRFLNKNSKENLWKNKQIKKNKNLNKT